MKKICCFAGMMVALWGGQNAMFAQQLPEGPIALNFTNLPGPRIKFQKLIWDFGKVGGGESVKAEFVFTNIGDKTLEISNVQPSCGCTTAGEWTRQVEPGQTGVVPLQFHTGNYNGQIIKTAAVMCNDVSTPQVTLQLKANIWRPIEITPQLAILQLTTETPSNAATVKIINNIETPLTLSDVESKSPAFGAELKTLKEGKEYELLVRTLPPFPTNNIQGQITIKSSSTNMPVISVTAYANVQPTIVAVPFQVSLPPAPLTNAVTQTVWIRNNSSNSIAVTEPAISVKGAEVKLTAFQQNRYFSLLLTFPAGTSVDPAVHPELTVKTSHPSYPVLRVPILQLQPAQRRAAAATPVTASPGH